MKSNYRPIGKYVKQVKERNVDLSVTDLQGISINKEFMPSVANVIGTDLSKYKVVRKYNFAYNPMHVGRDEVLPVSLLTKHEAVIVSPAYIVFEITDHKELDPEYLMMWMSRKEFDRRAWFTTDSSVRGGFSWDDFCYIELPVPHIDTQREIVREYKVLTDRIALNNQMIAKLEETAQTIYRQWFEEFEFPDENGNPYKSSGGAMEYNEELDKEVPAGWDVKDLKELCIKIGSGATPTGGRDSYSDTGISLIRSLNIYDFRFEYEGLAYISEQQAKKLNNVSVEKCDVLFNITGASVARCLIVPKDILPARVNQHVSIIRTKSELHATEFVMLTLSTNSSKAELLGLSDSGSTRQAITKTDLEDFRVLLPKETILKNFSCIANKTIESIQLSVLKNRKLSRFQNILLSKLATINN